MTTPEFPVPVDATSWLDWLVNLTVSAAWEWWLSPDNYAKYEFVHDYVYESDDDE